MFEKGVQYCSFRLKSSYKSKYLHLPDNLPPTEEEYVGDILLDSPEDHLLANPVERTQAMQAD